MNSSKRFAVTGIGNAIVDVIGKASEEFLRAEDLIKGSMALVDESRAQYLHDKLHNPLEQSGGSAGNTMAGIASLGGRGAYIGKVRNDALGGAFAEDIRSIGTHFETTPSTQGASTARCLIVVTPDAQRTMSTFLGACVDLGPEDIDPALVADSQVTYLEGYLWDPPRAKEAFLRAAQIAHEAGNRVALSLSDPFCVARHRDDFLMLVKDHVDILFANENEILSLYSTESFDDAVREVQQHCGIAALTRSEKGAVLVAPGAIVEVAATPVADIIDTTGAGDLFAAGFLHGLTENRSLGDCGQLGALAAAEVIGHFGARPQGSLKTWVETRSR